MDRFSKDGRWIIPLNKRDDEKKKHKEDKVRYVIKDAYCPNGCNIIDKDCEINGSPGLRIKFKRPGQEGEFVLSSIEGDFTKEILSGDLKHGVKDELYCPHCGVLFAKLVNCNCKSGADMVVIGLTKELDFNNAITFCNVTGCENGTFIDSGDIIRRLRFEGSM